MTRFDQALLAAALFAVDPAGSGVLLRAPAGPLRERWLDALRQALPAGTPLRRVPAHIGDERLLGGLDLAATLQAGRPVARRGLLAESDGGVLLFVMAERMSLGTAARIAAVLDSGQVVLERDGLAMQQPVRLGALAFDEGAGDEERAPAALAERLAIHLVLDGRGDESKPVGAETVVRARELLAQVHAGEDIVQALCEAALVLGIGSARTPLQALRIARAAAALDGREQVNADDAALAAALVLGPRATTLPQAPQDEPQPEPPPPADEQTPAADRQPDAQPGDMPLDDRVLEAALSALPPDLLARLRAADGGRVAPSGAGRSGAPQRSRWRGRPIGALRGELRAGARLDLIETLRAAAPWQPLRRRETSEGALRARPSESVKETRQRPGVSLRVQVRREDFHIKRFRQRRETTTIFAVDASGSAALQRLAEAKGAVELLLADCYVRRDRVALLAFRGAGAQLLLPPTRSLVRAKRCLAALPGGGGTPLAAGIDAAREWAEAVARQGGSAVIVLLTDGRANIARDGAPGRERAHADALASARLVRAGRLTTLWIDTARDPQPPARQLAAQMGALYLPLPHADARRVSQAVRNAQSL
jgi:magnesium chelatase subunit D